MMYGLGIVLTGNDCKALRAATELRPIDRQLLTALLTLEVHARDLSEDMREARVARASHMAVVLPLYVACLPIYTHTYTKLGEWLQTSMRWY